MANFLKDFGQPLVYRVIQPFIRLLTRMGITPNAITMIGFFLNIVAATIFIWGAITMPRDLRVVGWGGATILFAGLFDMIDGRLARVSGQESKYGALFDSVIDRYSELVMFLGICYYLVYEHYPISALFAFIAMIGSIMVSYVRARAEGLGVECKGGLMQRPERVLTIGISAIFCAILRNYLAPYHYTPEGWAFPLIESISVFTFPIFIMAILTNMTAMQRMRDSKQALNGR